MLRWRLLLGTVIIGLVCLLGWFDWYFEKRFGIVGIGLLPLLIGLLIPSCAELITLSRLAGARPQRLLVYLCTLLVVIMSWLAPIASGWAERALTQVSRPRMEFLMHATCGSWAFAALGISLILVFMTEIYRFKRPGVSLIHVAATMFTIVYLGLLSVFLIQIRLVGGIGYLVTFLLTVKMGDTGAYTIGRLFGRTKMAPALSPGKTIEGAVGALFFSCFTSWLMFCQILPNWSTWMRTGITPVRRTVTASGPAHPRLLQSSAARLRCSWKHFPEKHRMNTKICLQGCQPIRSNGAIPIPTIISQAMTGPERSSIM